MREPEGLQHLEAPNPLKIGGASMSELHTTIGDYRDLEILPDSVIYCDPPYKDTGGYGMGFDHEAFYNWCEKQTALVLISEYWMPEDRFACVAEFERRSTFSATNNAKREIEKVFVPKGQYERYKVMMKGARLKENKINNNLNKHRS